MVKIPKILYFFRFFLLISFLVNKAQEQYNEIISFESIYPNSLTLNNGNILIVAQKGIYLYNQSNYNITVIKEFPSDLYISNRNIATKTTFLQLPEKDGGYIIIFANDILYGLPPMLIQLQLLVKLMKLMQIIILYHFLKLMKAIIYSMLLVIMIYPKNSVCLITN